MNFVALNVTSLFLTISWGPRKLILSLQRLALVFPSKWLVFICSCVLQPLCCSELSKQHRFAQLAEHQLQASQSLRTFDE